MSTMFEAMRQRLAALAVRIGVPARRREAIPAEIDPGSRDLAGEPFGCVELYAGNEWAHRHVELPGLEGDAVDHGSDGQL